eukprot:4577578-Pyramimonas_sp.AAC.1
MSVRVEPYRRICCVRLVCHENIPVLTASDWSVVSIFLSNLGFPTSGLWVEGGCEASWLPPRGIWRTACEPGGNSARGAGHHAV